MANGIGSDGSGVSSTPSPLEQAQQELKDLEAERDAAVATAESCARAAMKLTDLIALLENMAIDKVKAGDEDVAKQVLREKASAVEVLDKTSTKAQVNYALAAALAQKIGTKQAAILELLKTSGPGGSASPSPSSSYPASPPQGGQAPSWSSTSSARSSSEPPSSSSSFGQGMRQGQGLGGATQWQQQSMGGVGGLDGFASSPGWQQQQGGGFGGEGVDAGAGGGYVFSKPKWQQSLEEAKQRISAAERDASRSGRAARLGAEESIAAAKDRLRAQATDSILSAQSRLSAQRKGADESILEAQERLRAQDAEVLAYVQRIMSRYRRGEYVSEEELEFAFQQLEKRFLL